MKDYEIKLNELYDGLVGEEGAYDEIVKFIGSYKAESERMSTGQWSKLINFKVIQTPSPELLQAFVVEAYDIKRVSHAAGFEHSSEKDLYKNLVDKFAELFKQGNMVSVRIDKPFSFDGSKFDVKDIFNIRQNHCFYLFLKALLENGLVEKFNGREDSLVFDGTDLNFFNLILASNVSAKYFEKIHYANDDHYYKVGNLPTDFEFSRKHDLYSPMPRVLSYEIQEPTKIIENPVPNYKNDKKYVYAKHGTGIFNLSAFANHENGVGYPSDISYATRFMFMALEQARDFEKFHDIHFTTYDEYFITEKDKNGKEHKVVDPNWIRKAVLNKKYHKIVNPSWIKQAIMLAAEYKKRGVPFDLNNVIKIIESFKPSDFEEMASSPARGIYVCDNKDYLEKMIKAYGEDSILVKELLNPIRPFAIKNESGEGAPSNE